MDSKKPEVVQETPSKKENVVTNGEPAKESSHPPEKRIKILQRPAAKVKKEKPELTSAITVKSLEEATQLLQLQMDGSKTPVTILQELLSRRGITPNYELIQIEGAIHEPIFRFRVSFKDKEETTIALGVGRSKKDAKHAAARALIGKLSGVELPEVSTASPSGTTTASTGDSNANTNGGEDHKTHGNPIGWLQEMCMTRRLPPPTYVTETEVGLPHERLFTIVCSILKYREVGKGKSKKIAKRAAAAKMWSRLQENPLDNAQITASLLAELKENHNKTRYENYYGDLKDTTVKTITTHHSNKVSQFHKTLKNSTGKKLLKLQKTCLREPNLDYVKLLNEIAAENQFEITFIFIEEKTYGNQFQCLVQISALPVGVCHGTAATKEEAKQQAAHNALEYLKIMTKK